MKLQPRSTSLPPALGFFALPAVNDCVDAFAYVHNGDAFLLLQPVARCLPAVSRQLVNRCQVLRFVQIKPHLKMRFYSVDDRCQVLRFVQKKPYLKIRFYAVDDFRRLAVHAHVLFFRA